MLKSFFNGRNNKLVDSESYIRTPLELSYRSSGPFVTEVPPSSYRSGLLGLRIADNPFFRTLSQNQREYSDSDLYRYYQAVQPAGAGDVMPVRDSRIASMPAMAACMPWWKITPEERLKQVLASATDGRFLGKEAVKLGADPETDYGWLYFGPVSENVGITEFNRQWKVYESIRKKGFQPTSSFSIHGEFLISDSDWAWVNYGGKHRFVALAAMGHQKIVVSAKNKYGPAFVRPEDVRAWPNVMNGWFTEEEALAVFWQMMSGRSTR